MSRIATLGPQGTFSDLATQAYIKQSNKPFETHYYPTLSDTFKAIGRECEFGMLPIENLSEGYVQVVLDHLMDTQLIVVAELLLPIQFSFIGNGQTLSQITDLYVQFVAHGQCSEFINQLGELRIHNTQSNMASLHLAQSKETGAGAIIPTHVLDAEKSVLKTALKKDQCFVENVTNYENNQTRFLLISTEASDYQAGKNYKTTLVVRNEDDQPGALSHIVNAFAAQKINLTSIMSRPTKSQFGHYHFFIDVDGHQQDGHLKSALKQIRKKHPVTVIGSYLRHLK